MHPSKYFAEGTVSIYSFILPLLTSFISLTKFKLIPFSSGKVEILGGKLKDKRNDLAYVPQTSDVNWNFPTTVEDVVLMGITAKRFGWSRISQESKMKVEKALPKS